MSDRPVITEQSERQQNDNRPTVSPTKLTRTLSIHAVGEVECSPDTCTLTITIASSKTSLEEAQSSVKRRSDYVLQVLRNNGIKTIQILNDITRGDTTEVKCTVVIINNNFENCRKARSILIEKLDDSVHCSPIECQLSLNQKVMKREEVFKIAVMNAKSKAAAVTQSLGVYLGPIVSLSEEKPTVISTEKKEHGFESNREGCDMFMKLQKATVIYSCNVSVVFEVVPLRKCNKTV